MQVFETNAGLGYEEYAYFIHIKDNQYLCIGLSRFVKGSFFGIGYEVGEPKNLEGYEICPSDYKIEESPLYGTFLFSEFLKNLSKKHLKIW